MYSCDHVQLSCWKELVCMVDLISNQPSSFHFNTLPPLEKKNIQLWKLLLIWRAGSTLLIPYFFLKKNIDLMDFLREIPSRQPLKVRAEASNLVSSYSYILLCERAFFNIKVYSFVLKPKPFHQVAFMVSTLRQQRTTVDKRYWWSQNWMFYVFLHPTYQGHFARQILKGLQNSSVRHWRLNHTSLN